MAQTNIYWYEPSMVSDGVVPSILAIGDSWFWYPLPGGSLATSLARLVAPREHTILAFGNNGAEAFDYVNGVYADRIERALERYGDGCSAVFVSGGGNDFAGFNDLRPILGLDCSTCATADACFNHGTLAGDIEELFDRVQAYHIELIDRVAARVPAAARIFVHNYDYAIPTGKGVIGKGWLRPALASRQGAGGAAGALRAPAHRRSSRAASQHSRPVTPAGWCSSTAGGRSRPATGRTSCTPGDRGSTRLPGSAGGRPSSRPALPSLAAETAYAPPRGRGSAPSIFLRSESTRLAYACVSSSTAPL